MVQQFFGISYEFDWGLPFREPFFSLFVTGIKLTLLIAGVTTVTSLVLGVVLGVMRSSESTVLRGVGTIYVEIFRNIPGLFWILFFYFAFPQMLPSAWSQALNSYTHFGLVAAILGLTFDNSSYVAEIVRSGIEAITRGQMEAAKAIGLTNWQRWSYVILPQAFRVVTPPLGTRFIHNLKNTSLAMVIAVPELTWVTTQVEALTFRGFEMTTVATVFYVVLCLTMATGVNWLEVQLTRQHGLRPMQ